MFPILEFKMFLLIICFSFLPSVFGGSRCPPRTDIRPCICMDRSIGRKKFETTLICPNLVNGDSISSIDDALVNMQIDKFLLYDSFWQTVSSSSSSQDQRTPVNFLSSYKIHELEIVDTVMTRFGCPEEYNCRTNVLKRFISINSTIPDRALSCTNNGLTVNLWISCPENLEYLEIDNGFPRDFTLKPEFFPQLMSKLKALHLPRNKLEKFDKKTLNIMKFPVLDTLDLSHNSLRDMKSIFSSTLKLQHLDLSYNRLRHLDITNLPHLKTLKLANNNINSILLPDWQGAPKSLMHIDLSSNPLNCDCSLKWVNSTFHLNSNLIGSCTAPAEVVNMKLRRASRLLNERCDEAGTILPSKIKAKSKTSNQGT